MSQRWPPEIDLAIGEALIASMPTSEIYRQLRTGELPGIERGYPDYPRSTFFSALRRVRKRLTESLTAQPASGESFVERLAREQSDDGFIARQRVKREQSAPGSIRETPQSRVPAPVGSPPPAPTSPPARRLWSPASNNWPRTPWSRSQSSGPLPSPSRTARSPTATDLTRPPSPGKSGALSRQRGGS
jgi:hypothetical protein